MGGSTSTTNTSSSQSMNQIPQWINDAGQQNYAYAQDIANRPLQQYQGQMVADVSPQQQQAWNVAANSGGVGADQYQGSTAGFLGALGQTPSSVTPQTLAKTDLSPYMNPYTQDVINKTLPIMQQQLGQQYAANAGSAVGSNAFGGSRFGVQQGVTQAQGAQNMAQMAAQLNQANFNQAQTAATGDISRDLAAQTTNQGAQQAKINSDILASSGLTTTGDSMQKANMANWTMLQAAGADQQQQQQNQINAQMAKFNDAWNYPQQGLNTMLSALGMTPHDTSTSSSGTSQSETSSTPNWAEIGSSLMGDALSLFPKPGSDKRLKKDIASLGKDPMTGVPIKSFRYKGQPSSAPKIVGPLAQDVEKAIPGSTVREQGMMAVPTPALAAATPSVAKAPNFAARKGLPVSAVAMPRAGARGLHGALANTKRRTTTTGLIGALG